jgi:hypothetical protein
MPQSNDAFESLESALRFSAPILPSRDQAVLHLEHAAHLACAHFGNLPVCYAVDDAEQLRSNFCRLGSSQPTATTT